MNWESLCELTWNDPFVTLTQISTAEVEKLPLIKNFIVTRRVNALQGEIKHSSALNC